VTTASAIDQVPAGILGKASILATVGSTAHGISVSQTGPEGDDLDLLGMYVPPRHQVYGLIEAKPLVWRSKPEGIKSEAGDVDLTLHPARKFIGLAAKGNPTILAALFSPEQHVDQFGNAPMSLVMGARNDGLFRSLSAGYAFRGYAEQQHKRLLGERGQMKVNRPELISAHGFDTKYAAHVLRLCHQGVVFMEVGVMPMPVTGFEADEILAVRRGDRSFDNAVEMIGEARERLNQAIGVCERAGMSHYPDTKRLDDLLLRVHEAAWA
jgi:hypothetical protein